MKKHNLLAVILLGAAAVNCDGSKNSEKNLFSLDTSVLKQKYQLQESLSLGIINKENEEIDSVAYYVNDKKVGTAKANEKLTFPLAGQRLGYQNIEAKVYYDGEEAQAEGRVELVSNVEPKLLKYEIVNTYPHDIKAYTQGLEFYRDTEGRAACIGDEVEPVAIPSDVRDLHDRHAPDAMSSPHRSTVYTVTPPSAPTCLPWRG